MEHDPPHRRRLLTAGLSLAAFGALAPTALLAHPTFRHDPFSLGVAAGDPAPDGFVIWTRLAPEPQTPDGGMAPVSVPVRWQVAEDEAFRRIVRSGLATANPDLAHSVHVEVDGLRPQRTYWYRFIVAGADASPVGRARTTPLANAPADQLRIAMVGCQDFQRGLYTAYGHMANEPDLDLVYHYGDYIYETGPAAGAAVRRHLSAEVYSLDDYRRRYAQYKADPDLQAAHRAVAFVVAFDDHEIDNNWAGAYDQDGSPQAVFALRKAAALQAWYEHMPVRRAQRPGPTGVSMYRRLDYGSLARMHVLDTRSYRDDQLCEAPGLSAADLRACRGVDRPERSMLGARQEAWLDRGLDATTGWNFIAQQVLFLPYDSRKDGETTPGGGNDSWMGYPFARDRLVKSIADRGLTNVVIGSGDVHQHFVGSVPRRAEDLTGPAIASEFLATSISSNGTGGPRYAGELHALDHNPHVQLLNNQRGYQLFTITPKLWAADIKVVDQVDRPGGALNVLAKFVVDPGRPGPIKA